MVMEPIMRKMSRPSLSFIEVFIYVPESFPEYEEEVVVIIVTSSNSFAIITQCPNDARCSCQKSGKNMLFPGE